MVVPPEFGPLAVVTPGTPGGLLVMLAEWGKLSLKDVRNPAICRADSHPRHLERLRIQGSSADKTIWPAPCGTMGPSHV